jgi:hypothetical protein
MTMEKRKPPRHASSPQETFFVLVSSIFDQSLYTMNQISSTFIEIPFIVFQQSLAIFLT